MPFSIRLFGKLRVEREGQMLSIPTGRPRELFAYLLLHPRRIHHRETLSEILFPETEPQRARRHLCDVIYRLKHALGPGFMQTEGDYLSIVESDLWVDVWEFNRTQHPIQAIDLYDGDLLEELDASWLLPARAQLRDRGIILLEQECRELLLKKDHAAALDLAHRWIEVEPLAEQAHCVAMRVYAHLGRLSRALDQYGYLSSLLNDELGIEPSKTARNLRDLIQHEHDSLATTDEPLFVGRRRERAQLAQTANAACEGHGTVVLLDGAAGVGKTRLLDVFAESASWRGLNVVRADESDPRSGIDALSDPQPQTILLDNAHAAASEMWEAILDMAPSIPDRHLVLLLSGRSNSLRRNEQAWRVLRRLDDEAALDHCRLEGLSVAECSCLAHAIGTRHSTQDVSRIHEHTGGNPQLFIEALRLGKHPTPLTASPSERSLRSVKVELTRTDVPLGRSLTDADRTVVELTVEDQEVDDAFLRQHGSTALRRQRLKRMVAEARSQGAAPTHEDLARLLACSVRTIARDMIATGSIGTRRAR